MQVQMMNAWCKNLLHSHLWESCKCHCSLSLLLYQINIIFTIWGCLLLQYLGKRKKSIKFNRLRIEVLFIPIITPPMCMCEALNPSLTLELFFYDLENQKYFLFSLLSLTVSAIVHWFLMIKKVVFIPNSLM